MINSATTYRDQVLAALDTVPDEYLPFVLQIIQSFNDNILLKPAVDSFRQGWQEATNGETYPLADLWSDVDDD